MTILITGCAGFIGFHLSNTILKKDKKIKIIGIDNLNNYYSSRYKKKIKAASRCLQNSWFKF